MGEVEPRLQSCTSASQALLCSWQVLSNQRAAIDCQAPDITSPSGCYSAPGSGGGAALGADAPVAAVPQLHTASLSAGAGGQGQEQGKADSQEIKAGNVLGTAPCRWHVLHASGPGGPR